MIFFLMKNNTYGLKCNLKQNVKYLPFKIEYHEKCINEFLTLFYKFHEH